MPILTTEERLGSYLAGKYRLDRVLGKGGFGVVYAGVHEWTGREIAAKVLNHDLAEQPEFVNRFLQEARSAASLSHPNVVDVLDMGEDTDGTVYLVLELLRGEDLKTRLRREKTLSEQVAVELLSPVMEALSKAHEQGIVHRDLKPDNIYLSVDGKGKLVPKLLDFGIAKTSDASASQTHTGQVIGTPHYMSPEQARGSGKVGPEADVWSMGVVFWQCLTGTLPFDADSPTGVLADLLTRRAVPIRRVKPTLHRPIAGVIDRALTWERAKRYPNMRAFLDALVAAAREPHEAPGPSADRTGPLQSLGSTPLLEGLDGHTPQPMTPPEHMTGPLAGMPSSTPSSGHGWQTSELPPERSATPSNVTPAPASEGRSWLAMGAAVVFLSLVGASVVSLIVLWPDENAGAAVAASESAPPDLEEPTEPEPEPEPLIAEPTSPEPEGPTTSDRARDCSAQGDHACVVQALEGHAETAADLVLLIEAYRAIGNREEAERHIHAFIERFPDTPRAAAYREQQARAARRDVRRPNRPAAQPTASPVTAPRVGANRAPILR
jgi:serine/threonine protein kinase